MRVIPTRTTVVVVVAALAAACGGGGDGDGGTEARPAERLAEAVTRLAAAGTGHFASQATGSDGVVHSAMEGDYQLTPPAAQITVTRHDAEGQRATEVVAIGRDVWSRDADSAAEQSCWVHYDVTELFTSGLLVRNGDTYVPAPVAVAGFGLGIYATDADQVTGTAELSRVLAVADLSLPSLLGLSQSPDQRVLTTFTIDDGVLGGWKVFVRDAVERARKFAVSSAAGDSLVSALSGLGGAITTQLTAQGEPIDVTPPSAVQTIAYVEDSAELSRRLAACQPKAP